MPAVNSKPKAIVEVPLPRGSKLPKGVVSQARKILRSASVGAAKWELLLLFAIFTMHNKDRKGCVPLDVIANWAGMNSNALVGVVESIGLRYGHDYFFDSRKKPVIIEDLTTGTLLEWRNDKGVLLTVRAMQQLLMALEGEQGQKVRAFITDVVLPLFQANATRWADEAAIDNDRAEARAARQQSVRNFRAISRAANPHFAAFTMGSSFKNDICGFGDENVKATFKARRGVGHKAYRDRLNSCGAGLDLLQRGLMLKELNAGADKEQAFAKVSGKMEGIVGNELELTTPMERNEFLTSQTVKEQKNALRFQQEQAAACEPHTVTRAAAAAAGAATVNAIAEEEGI